MTTGTEEAFTSLFDVTHVQQRFNAIKGLQGLVKSPSGRKPRGASDSLATHAVLTAMGMLVTTGHATQRDVQGH